MSIRVLIRDKGDGRRLTLYYVDALTGREITKSAKTRDREQAQRAAARWEDELNGGTRSARANWESTVKRFLESGCQGRSSNTIENYERDLALFAKIMGAPRDIGAITPLTIDDFSKKWRASQTGKWSEATLGKHLRGLRCFLNWCERMQIIQRSPMVPMPATTPSEEIAITESQWKELRKALPKPWHEFADALWLSGMRSEEAMRLHWEKGPVRLILNGPRRSRLLFDVEGQKARRQDTRPLFGDFIAFLEKLPRRDGYVLKIPSRIPTSASHAFERACENLDFKVTPKQLRKSFATRWAPKVPPAVLQAVMGHASISTTAKWYVHLGSDPIADAVAKASARRTVPKSVPTKRLEAKKGGKTPPKKGGKRKKR